MAFRDDHPEQAELRDERFAHLCDYYGTIAPPPNPGAGRYVLCSHSTRGHGYALDRVSSLKRCSEKASAGIAESYEPICAFDLDVLTGPEDNRWPARHVVAGIVSVVIFDSVPTPVV